MKSFFFHFFSFKDFKKIFMYIRTHYLFPFIIFYDFIVIYTVGNFPTMLLLWIQGLNVLWLKTKEHKTLFTDVYNISKCSQNPVFAQYSQTIKPETLPSANTQNHIIPIITYRKAVQLIGITTVPKYYENLTYHIFIDVQCNI